MAAADASGRRDVAARLDPFDITARAREAYGPDGRPDMTTWMDVLAPLAPDRWRAIRAHVRTSLDAPARPTRAPSG